MIYSRMTCSSGFKARKEEEYLVEENRNQAVHIGFQVTSAQPEHPDRQTRLARPTRSPSYISTRLTTRTS